MIALRLITPGHEDTGARVRPRTPRSLGVGVFLPRRGVFVPHIPAGGYLPCDQLAGALPGRSSPCRVPAFFAGKGATRPGQSGKSGGHGRGQGHDKRFHDADMRARMGSVIGNGGEQLP